MEFINLSSFDSVMRRSSGSISWRSKSSSLVLLFWRIWRRRLRFLSPNLQNRPSFPRQRGLKAEAAPGLTFLNVPESHLCVVNTRSGRWACLWLFMCWNRCFIYSYFTAWLEYLVSGHSASRSANKWILWNVQQVMILSCWGKIEDFFSCWAARVEFVRNPSKQDCNCETLLVHPAELQSWAFSRQDSIFNLLVVLGWQKFPPVTFRVPESISAFFLQLLLLDWRLQAVAAWLDW